MLRMDKLTVKAQEALQSAQELAASAGQQQIEPVHLLAALLAQGDGVVTPLLAKLGAQPDALSAEVRREIDRLPKVSGAGQQYLSPASNDVLSRAFDEAGNSRTNTFPPNTFFSLSRNSIASPPANCSPATARVTMPFFRRLSASAAAIASRARIPKQRIAPSNNMLVISPSLHGAAKSIPSLAATKKYAASCRFLPAARRTILY